MGYINRQACKLLKQQNTTRFAGASRKNEWQTVPSFLKTKNIFCLNFHDLRQNFKEMQSQTFSKMSAMVEDTNEVPHADYGGDLLAGDEVKISGLTSEKGLKLNGCTGFIVPLNLKNDGTLNPTLACRPDGKYQVRITNTKAGRHMNKMETKVYIMKRKNLNPTKVSPSPLRNNSS